MGLFMTGDDLVGWIVWIVHTFFTIIAFLQVISAVSGVPILDLWSNAELELYRETSVAGKNFRRFMNFWALIVLLMSSLSLITFLGVISKFYISPIMGTFFDFVCHEFHYMGKEEE